MNFPADLSCDRCTLQLVWTNPQATYYSCADITLIGDKIMPCIGKCQNDGVCSNGACVCNEPYYGDHCQYRREEEQKIGYLWILYILLGLAIIGLLAAAYWFYTHRPKSEERPPIPFIDEKPDEGVAEKGQKAEQPKKEEESKFERAHAKTPFEEEEQQKPSQEVISGGESASAPKEEKAGAPVQGFISDECPNGHTMTISDSAAGYPGGYYMCANCNRVLPCVNARWNCAICSVDVCMDCKPGKVLSSGGAPEDNGEPQVEQQFEDDNQQIEHAGRTVDQPSKGTGYSKGQFVPAESAYAKPQASVEKQEFGEEAAKPQAKTSEKFPIKTEAIPSKPKKESSTKAIPEKKKSDTSQGLPKKSASKKDLEIKREDSKKSLNTSKQEQKPQTPVVRKSSSKKEIVPPKPQEKPKEQELIIGKPEAQPVEISPEFGKDEGVEEHGKNEFLPESAGASPEHEGEGEQKEEEKGGMEGMGGLSGILGSAITNAALAAIKKVIVSKQTDTVVENRAVNDAGKVTWTKTHFIFVIDCSGSMKGSRWESVKTGYTACLKNMKNMKDVIISAFTFDDKANPFCKERPPSQAITISKNMPFSGKGTDYKRALDYAISLIKKSTHPDYAAVIVFLSDGTGGYPEDCIKELQTMKASGKKILFYTIACETDEEDDMMAMASNLDGEHLKVLNTDAAKLVFSNILGF